MPLAWFISAVLHLQFSYKNNIDSLCECVCVFVHLFAFKWECVPKCIVYVCVWHNFLPIFFHNLNQRKCINFAGVRGAHAELVNKSLLLLPTMPCQVHTSFQHIIINCTLNYSVQLTMREWMERERGMDGGVYPVFKHSLLIQTQIQGSDN